MTVKRADYAQFVRMAYQRASDTLRITIPDKVSFPSQHAYVSLRDSHIVILSPNPAKGAVHLAFLRNSATPGCRELHLQGVKLIGPHFRITPVQYMVEGPDLLLCIPEENERLPPKGRGNRKQWPRMTYVDAPPRRDEALVQLAPGEPGELVTITGLGSRPLTYRIPTERAIDLLDELAEYRTRD